MVHAQRLDIRLLRGSSLRKIAVSESEAESQLAGTLPIRRLPLARAVRWAWPVPLAAAVLIAAFVAPKAQPKAPALASEDVAILAADKALGDVARAGDRSSARKMLALQFSFVSADGRFFSRKDFLDDLKNVATAPATDATVRDYGLLELVSGRRHSARNGDVAFFNVWARQKGAWRALVSHEVNDASASAPAAASSSPAMADVQSPECRNPCQNVPYRVRSAAEQDVINAFQALEKAVVAHDASEWAKHVAEELVVYRSGHAPVMKAERVATIERQKETGAPVAVGEVTAMRLAVYGDAAAMLAGQAVADHSRPPYRALRLWVKRGGGWLLALSAQTDAK